MQGFKNFLLRGNVVDLAIAVVIGAAFTAIITAFTTAIIDPLIAMAFNADAIEDATVGEFKIGLLIAAIINFVIVAAVVYFLLVLPIQKLQESRDKARGITPEEPEADVDVLRDIRTLLQQQAGQSPTGASNQ